MKIINVFATTGFSYIKDAGGGRCLIHRNGVHSLPEAVALRAIEAEAALDMSTAEGKAAHAAVQESRYTPRPRRTEKRSRQVYFPLGDVMGLQQAAG